jgi:prevent-host-death family protein
VAARHAVDHRHRRETRVADSFLARADLVLILDQTYVILYANRQESTMTSITVTQARANLFKLLDQTAQSHEPIQITGRRQNGVLLSEDDFRAMQETLYLLSVPGMKESLRKARKAPLKAYSKTRPW